MSDTDESVAAGDVDRNGAELLDEPRVINTTRIQLSGDTPQERRGELFDAIRDISVSEDDSVLCRCGSEAQNGPHRALCPDCNDTFVPESCPVCARPAQLVSVGSDRVCQTCAEAWRDKP